MRIARRFAATALGLGLLLAWGCVPEEAPPTEPQEEPRTEDVLELPGGFFHGGLQVDGQHLYYFQASLQGPATLYRVNALGPPGEPVALASISPLREVFKVGDSHIYYFELDPAAQVGRLKRLPKAGGPAELLASGPELRTHFGINPSTLLVGEYIYWLHSLGTDTYTFDLYRTTRDTPGPIEKVSAGPGFGGNLMATETHIYWFQGGAGLPFNLVRVPRAAATATREVVFSAPPGDERLALTWEPRAVATSSGIYALLGKERRALVKLPLAPGGEPVFVDERLELKGLSMDGLTVEGNTLYYSVQGAGVQRSLDGGAPTQVPDSLDFASEIALTPSHFYFLSGLGIRRMRR